MFKLSVASVVGRGMLMAYDEAGARSSARPRTSCEARVIAVLPSVWIRPTGDAPDAPSTDVIGGRLRRVRPYCPGVRQLVRKRSAGQHPLVSSLLDKARVVGASHERGQGWCALCTDGRRSLRCPERTGDDDEIAKPCRGPCMFVRLLSCVGGSQTRGAGPGRGGGRPDACSQPTSSGSRGQQRRVGSRSLC